MNTEKYITFKDFYPFYLSQHQNTICRLLHFIGTSIIIILLIFYVDRTKDLLLIPFVGYGFAWIGHFFFEKNKPATFKYPIYSLMGDFVMFWQILTRKEKI